MNDDFITPLTSQKFLLPVSAGGKASALSELIGNGYNVPKGFVVTIPAIQKLIESQPDFNNILRKDREYRNSLNQDVNAHAKALRNFVSGMRCPGWFFVSLAENLDSIDTDLYAVRSSAAMEDGMEQSWAGMFDSYLEIDRDSVFRHICMCCASYFSDRSISYRRNLIPEISDIEFAVVVQEMVPASVSCVVFSEDPADPSKVRIEAAIGLGTALVGGQLTPATFLLDRTSGILVERNERADATETLLSIGLLSQIYDIAMGVDAAFGFSVDIELSIVDTEVFILQARRITSRVSDSSDRYKAETLPNIANYELTFKVHGLDFLFSDMLARGFGYLDPLLISVDGEFRQYFPRKMMHWAALEGYRWLSDDSEFDEYKKSYYEFNNDVRKQLAELFSHAIDEKTVKTIFDLFASIMNRYSHMDFQFTNLVWHYAETDETVAVNLEKLSKFKDDARAWLNDILLDENGYYAKTIENLTNTLKRNADEITNMTINELIQELESGRLVESSLVETRKDCYAIYVTDGHIDYVSDAELIKKRYSNAPSSLGDGHKLFGQIANRTKDEIKGLVRIINVDYANPNKMQSEMDEMNEGEILVSEFTAPELMPACRKALAIVTDLGGMLSHAAIVSRELGIPCLIGTGKAASIFKTGDDATIDFTACCIYPTSPTVSDDN